MELAELILEYIRVLVYPTLVAVVLLLFKKEIRELFQGKVTARYKDIEIVLERERRANATQHQNQTVVLTKLKEEVSALPKPWTENRKTMINSYVRALLELSGYWQNLIVDYLRNHDGRASTANIVESLTKDSDPWHKGKDEDEVRCAIEDLQTKGFVQFDQNGSVSIHQLFLGPKS